MRMHLKETHNHLAADSGCVFEVSAKALALSTHKGSSSLNKLDNKPDWFLLFAKPLIVIHNNRNVR